MYKNIWTLLITNLFLAVGLVLALIYDQLEVAFMAALMLGVSLIPYYFKGVHNIHIPIGFIYGSIVFIFASIGLGQFNQFYDKFHWYDAFLHFIASIVFGIVGFLIIYVFYVTNRLRLPRAILVLFAFSFAMMIGSMWEIFEFVIDQTFGTNLQVSSLEDTMVDLILDAIGALVASGIGIIYLSNVSVPVIETIVEEVTSDIIDENKEMAEEVKNIQ